MSPFLEKSKGAVKNEFASNAIFRRSYIDNKSVPSMSQANESSSAPWIKLVR